MKIYRITSRSGGVSILCGMCLQFSHLAAKIAILFFGAFMVAGTAFAGSPTYDIPVVITGLAQG